jgi:hypothetical protein
MTLSTKIKETTLENTKLKTVPLNWKEVYYSNCPLVSASNVDEGLGLTKQEFKKIGVKYRANAHVSAQFGSSLAALCQHLHKILVIPPCFETLSVSPTLGRFLLCQ